MLSLTGKLLIDEQEINLSEANITTVLNPGYSEAVLTISGVSPDEFQEGQKVELFLGYERYGLNNEFSGMIESVSPKKPVELRCTDYFYELRRTRINRAFNNLTIENILKQVAQGFDIVTDSEAKSKKINAACYSRTARWLIMKLCNDYGFVSFFRDKKLHFVKQEYLETIPADEAIYEEGKNIFEDDLYYHTAQKVGKVSVYSETKNGYLIRAPYGDGKDEKVYTIDGLSNGEACWERAKEIYEELNYEGFKGEFKTFGYPFIHPGMYASIISETSGKSGVYRCDKVVTEFGVTGFKRTVTIGVKHKTKVATTGKDIWN
ncbi:MAG: hypothetical protein FWH53_00070 [Leptospirales bacterium]|nr:hypothetical protein [Leptospirales bacterium]